MKKFRKIAACIMAASMIFACCMTAYADNPAASTETPAVESAVTAVTEEPVPEETTAPDESAEAEESETPHFPAGAFFGIVGIGVVTMGGMWLYSSHKKKEENNDIYDDEYPDEEDEEV